MTGTQAQHGHAHSHGHGERDGGRARGASRLTLVIVLALILGSASGYAMQAWWPAHAAGFADGAALLPFIFLRLIKRSSRRWCSPP